jgi:NAD(P)-dependent dehydrogenase (short-subunit alcohol dehydrogenase family)
MSNLVLDNKVAIITGGAHGLGFEIAKQFASQGARILICGRNRALLKKASKILNSSVKPNSCDYLVCDVSVEKDIKNLVKKTLDKYGSISILVNNAGIQGDKGKLEEANVNNWKKTIEINLIGSVLMCKEIIPVFKKNNYGKIIQMSGGGATQPSPFLSSYAASKAAIVRFIETIAVELEGTNIDANCIAPGAVNTGMVDEIISAGPEIVGKDLYLKSIEQKKSGGASPEHCANLAVFLASSMSDGITGKLISALWDNYLDWPQNIKSLLESDAYTLRRIIGSDRGLNWGDK